MNKNIKMVVFDWAGTTVDYGSCAPADVFRLIFNDAGIELTCEEINGPMGMEKKAHIRSIFSFERVSALWKEKHGKAWCEEDVENLYTAFEEKLYTVVSEYSKPIDGVVDTVKWLRENDIKVGSTTGYNNKIMEKVIHAAEEKGYSPDCIVTPDITGAGRPTPFMLYECMRKLNVYPIECVVKVGDTLADIYEGKNAGAWSVGILTGSSLLGLTEEEYKNKDGERIVELKEATTKKYLDAGADFVIDNITELPSLIKKINETLEGR